MPQGAPARDRAEAASSLLSSTTRMLVTAGDDDPDRLKIYAELASELLDRASRADRIETAKLLADFAPAPRTILRRLARDEWAVAEPILTRAKHFTAIDLLGLLAVVPQSHAEAIARRADLCDDVVLALINRGEPAVAKTLLANPAFNLTRERADALAAIGHEDHVILAALGRAPKAEANGATSLFAALDEAARARLIATLEARRALQPRGGRAGARAAIPTMTTSAGEMFALATRGAFDAIASRLAEALRLDPDRVTASVFDPGGEPLLVLLRAAGLAAPEAMRVLLFHPTLGRDIAKVRWLGELNERLGQEGALLLIDDWRGRDGARRETEVRRALDPTSGIMRPEARPARPPADRAIDIIRARLR